MTIKDILEPLTFTPIILDASHLDVENIDHIHQTFDQFDDDCWPSAN